MAHIAIIPVLMVVALLQGGGVPWPSCKNDECRFSWPLLNRPIVLYSFIAGFCLDGDHLLVVPVCCGLLDRGYPIISSFVYGSFLIPLPIMLLCSLWVVFCNNAFSMLVLVDLQWVSLGWKVGYFPSEKSYVWGNLCVRLILSHYDFWPMYVWCVDLMTQYYKYKVVFFSEKKKIGFWL